MECGVATWYPPNTQPSAHNQKHSALPAHLQSVLPAQAQLHTERRPPAYPSCSTCWGAPGTCACTDSTGSVNNHNSSCCIPFDVAQVSGLKLTRTSKRTAPSTCTRVPHATCVLATCSAHASTMKAAAGQYTWHAHSSAHTCQSGFPNPQDTHNLLLWLRHPMGRKAFQDYLGHSLEAPVKVSIVIPLPSILIVRLLTVPRRLPGRLLLLLLPILRGVPASARAAQAPPSASAAVSAAPATAAVTVPLASAVTISSAAGEGPCAAAIPCCCCCDPCRRCWWWWCRPTAGVPDSTDYLSSMDSIAVNITKHKKPFLTSRLLSLHVGSVLRACTAMATADHAVQWM
jgi:hypothetical protein